MGLRHYSLGHECPAGVFGVARNAEALTASRTEAGLTEPAPPGYRTPCLMSDSSTAVRLPPRRHLVPEAAASIRAAVAGGRWPVGSQLPSEPQLATDLGVSRATLREGLRLLISERLLDRRPG